MFFSCIKDVVVGCFIEQINGRGGSLGEHVVVQSCVHLIHILHLQSDVQCLRQGCDLYMVTLHGHGLYFLQSQNKRREAKARGARAALAPSITVTPSVQGW